MEPSLKNLTDRDYGKPKEHQHLVKYMSDVITRYHR